MTIHKLARLIRRRRNKCSARELRNEWVAWLENGGFRQATITQYVWITDMLLARFPGVAFDEFTDEQIVGLIEEANPASRISRRAAFHNWFGWGYRTKRIPRNPMDHVPGYKKTQQEIPDVFDEAEQKLLRALPDPDGTLLAVMLGTGLRKSECRHLTVKRCDLEHREIHVVEGAKGGHPRVVPIDPELANRLAGYFLTEGLNDNDKLWYTVPGGGRHRRHVTAMAEASFHDWWKKCLDRAGVRYRKPHTTRHTYATDWRRRGLMVDDVGWLLGHADVRTTQQVYVHTSIYDIRRRMEALNGE